MTRLTIDDLSFEVRESSRRKTLAITAEGDGELVIAAPTGTDTELVCEFVGEKRL